MAKAKAAKKVLDSYTVKGTHKAVKVGDTVLMRGQEADKPPYVAKIEKIEADSRNNVKVRVRWYYRPEESLGGRRQFHGVKELFLSDHYDMQSADTIEGKCTVHTFKNYTKLESVGSDDYFCRFEYKAATGGFTPDRVAVYCKCEMPYNPDDLMVQCESCKDWFHSYCVDLTLEQVTNMDKYMCSSCAPENHKRASAPSHKTPDIKCQSCPAHCPVELNKVFLLSENPGSLNQNDGRGDQVFCHLGGVPVRCCCFFAPGKCQREEC